MSGQISKHIGKHNTNCCVYGCTSRKGKDRTTNFHYFPKLHQTIVERTNAFGNLEKLDVRKAWELALLMGKPVTKNMRVCSKHFRKEDYIASGLRQKARLQKTAVPSQNLPTKSLVKNCMQRDSQRYLRMERRQILREAICQETLNLCDVNATEAGNISQDIQGTSALNTEVNATTDPGNISQEGTSALTFDHLSTEEKVCVNVLLQLGNVHESALDKGIQVKSGDILVSFVDSVTTDKQLNSLTGIPRIELLNSLVRQVKNFYPDKKQKRLSVKERILLVFMKLKMSLKFRVLSFIFQISAPLCRSIFDEYVSYLSNILNCAIPWPSKEEIERNMPTCFANFRSVRIILDCIEIPVQKPKCLCCRIKTYSHYKGQHTIKIMTGVSPGGLITFVSKSYGGRSSDKIIFTQSNVITKLNPHVDAIMVDKGFLIDDVCNLNKIKLYRPFFLRKKTQFSEGESKTNVDIARARVHIERANQRIRIFEILKNPLPWSLVCKIDEILIIICGMVNLQAPLLADDKF